MNNFFEIFRFLFSKKTRIIFIPAIIVLLIASILLGASQGTAWAPFIYTVF
ncbi:DUF5989 family protein [Niveispirillum irakense]|uniref:DUF5989 family protein n=1 Tax=Niveispirillum irakense TaxID=34011 RepID=UPI003CCB8CD7